MENTNTKTKKTGSGRKARPGSLIAAAITILQNNGCPMSCVEIISEAVNSGLWQPSRGGKTPANTLSAAIRREIAVKGNASRFRLVSRGMYELAF